jgi:hypothetical protein
MQVSHRVLTVAVLAAVAGVALALPALGASGSDDWIAPLSEGADSLTDSLISIGAPILGLCIAGFGAWAVMTNRLDFQRLWMFLLGGALIGVGKPFGTWFMGLFGS